MADLTAKKQQFEATVSRLREKFPDAITTSVFRDNFRVVVPAEQAYRVLDALKAFGFDFLAELGAADYLRYPDARDRYGVWYCLTNIGTGERIIVKTFVNDPEPKLPSVYNLWKGSDWMEREVYDMYGVEFTGHPDLRRVLMPDEFTSFPLRKDYPLRGKGERHNFPTITRADS